MRIRMEMTIMRMTMMMMMVTKMMVTMTELPVPKCLLQRSAIIPAWLALIEGEDVHVYKFRNE